MPRNSRPSPIQTRPSARQTPTTQARLRFCARKVSRNCRGWSTDSARAGRCFDLLRRQHPEPRLDPARHEGERRAQSRAVSGSCRSEERRRPRLAAGAAQADPLFASCTGSTAASREPLAGDGLITNTAGLLLAIKTADCVPVLVADVKRRAVGAFHAGWRGTVARVVEKGIGEMRRQFGSVPRDLRAVIGPSHSAMLLSGWRRGAGGVRVAVLLR